MSFPRYERYKDSGVEWLGEVPEGWKLVPLWTMFRRTKRTGYPDDELLSVYRDHGVIPKSSRDDNFNKPSDDLSNYQLVMIGDLAINKMKAWQGSVAISDFKGIVSPAYFVYEAKHQQARRYLHYLMRSLRYITGYLTISKGIRVNQWDLEPQMHSRIPVLVPSFPEQQAIATFLDRETAKIDELINEQTNLIGLLKEKRQAVISHAVTKGLDPDAPMKDSGVEWLGEVPEEWEVKRLKQVTPQVTVGIVVEPSKYYADEGVPALRSLNVGKCGGIETDNLIYISEEGDFANKKSRLNQGDLVAVRSGQPGTTAVIPLEFDGCNCVDLIIIRKPSTGNEYFLYWFLGSDSAIAQFHLGSGGAIQQHFNVSAAVNLILPWPNSSEQQAIVDFLDAETSKLEELTSEAERSIELLKERRSALISAAVTGKIDVRNHGTEEAA